MARFPQDLPAAIAIVQHVGAHGSVLPSLLESAGPLPATHAKDGEKYLRGRIYVAPPDFHLLVDGECLRLSHGPKENFARPAIDPLLRSGLYPDSIIADVTPGRLRQFFSKDAAHYRIKKELREHMLFAHHNVLSDPPFSRLDLICCRNLLIYLDREAQIEILKMFHFALRPGGILFLGSSESADSVTSMFSVVDKRHRIYCANMAV